jgi:hypothetical protein
MIRSRKIAEYALGVTISLRLTGSLVAMNTTGTVLVTS